MIRRKKPKRIHKHDVALHRQKSQSYHGVLFSEPIRIIPQVKNVRSEKTGHEHSVTVNNKDMADKHEILCTSALKTDLSLKIAKEQDRRLTKRDQIRAVPKAKDIARLKPRGKDLSDISPNINIKESVCGKTKSDKETSESSLPAQTSTSEGDSDNKRHFLDIFHTICDSTSSKIGKKPLSYNSEDETIPFVEENCDSTSSKIRKKPLSYASEDEAIPFVEENSDSTNSKIEKMPWICHNEDETIPYMEGNSEHSECSTEESLLSGVHISRIFDFTDDLNSLIDGRKQRGHDVINSDISDEKSRCKGMDVVHSNSYSRIEDKIEEPKYDTDESDKTLFAIAPTSSSILFSVTQEVLSDINVAIEESHAVSLNNCLTPFNNSFNTVTSSPADHHESFLTSHLDMDSPPKDLIHNSEYSDISDEESGCNGKDFVHSNSSLRTEDIIEKPKYDTDESENEANTHKDGSNRDNMLLKKVVLSADERSGPSDTKNINFIHNSEYSDISDEENGCNGIDDVHSNLSRSKQDIKEEPKYDAYENEKTLFAIASTSSSILLSDTQEVSSDINVSVEKSSADSLNNCLTPFGTVTSSLADINESFLTSHLDMDRPSKDLIFNNFPVRGRKRRIRFRRTSNLVMNVSSSMEIASIKKQRLCPVLNDINILPDVQKLPPLPDSYQTFIESLNEEGSFDLEQAFQYLDYSRYSIPKLVTGLMLKYGILDPKVSVVNFNRSCQMLQEVCARTPGCVDLHWEVVSECLRQLTSSQSFPDRRQRQVRLLVFLVNIIKIDLRGHLSDMGQMPTALAYRLLAYSVANSNRKELVNFLGKCLQYECFTDDNIKKKVIHLVQTLLTLCVEVSSSCVDCTNGLSQELKLLYTDLPAGDSGRPLLLNSISSPLLSLKLCQLLLETQYTDTRSVDTLGLPESLAEIRRAYFQAIPIKTPMSAESDSSYEEEEKEAQRDTEELCNIILTCVTSFLQVAIGNYEKPLRLREPRATSGMWNMTERQDFRDHVDRLEEHLRSLSPNLSQQCESYLARLQILVDAD